MNNTEYTKLWNDNFKDVFKGTLTPILRDHLERERMVEDYLDIFRGTNTRSEELLMPYPHPYFNSDGSSKFKKELKIKFILIGECPNSINPTIPKTGCMVSGGDINNTYFYNILHLKRTNYLSSPMINWGSPDYNPCPENKIDCLLGLAEKGVFLIDLFPFTLPFGKYKNPTSLRVKLNKNGTTRSFWDEIVNPYNLNLRINRISSLLDNNWDLSFVSPCKISEYIINPINLFPEIKTTPIGLHPLSFRSILYDSTRCSGSNWRKIAVTSGGSPSQHLINVSF
jgi:hypothetical protein